MLKQQIRLSLAACLVFFTGVTPAFAQTKMNRLQAPPNTNTTKIEIDEDDESELILTWRLGLEANQRQDIQAQQRTETTVSAGLNLNYKLNSFATLIVSPRASFRNGYAQSSTASASKGSQFDVTEASGNLNAEEWFQFSVGALNQQVIHSQLLFSDLAFPAVRIKAQMGLEEESNAALYFQSAVPSSTSTTPNSQESEKTPSLISTGFSTNLKYQGFTAKLRATYFKFSNLPSGIAKDSGLNGNTTVGSNTNPGSEFLYEFEGQEGGINTEFNLTRNFSTEIFGHMVRNQKAPQTLNQGFTVGTALNMTHRKSRWSPSFEYYRIEPDAAVAYFNDSNYQTNRIGYSTGLKYQYKKQFSIKASGGERNVIFESASQYRERFYSLTLETLSGAF